MAPIPPSAPHRDHVEERLLGRFPQADRRTVHQLVEQGWLAYAQAAVTTFVPVLVERQVAQALLQSQR
jgi:hypothetical protein